KSGMLYPNGAPWIQEWYSPCFPGPLAPALRPECCYFLHLPSYHLPCLPARAKRRPNLHGPPFFFCRTAADSGHLARKDSRSIGKDVLPAPCTPAAKRV